MPTNKVNPWDECVTRWIRDTQAGLKWKDDPRYLEVRYETLVERPEETLRHPGAWLDEQWDDAMLSYYVSHEERGSDVANPGVKKPVYTKAVSRWRSDLSAEALQAFTDEAHQLLIRLGYARDRSWTGEVAQS